MRDGNTVGLLTYEFLQVQNVQIWNPQGNPSPSGVITFIWITGSWSLRDMEVILPPAVSLGETVNLTCQYHLQGEHLYTAKLYKGRHEFLQLVPAKGPKPLKTFPLKGVTIEVSWWTRVQEQRSVVKGERNARDPWQTVKGRLDIRIGCSFAMTEFMIILNLWCLLFFSLWFQSITLNGTGKTVTGLHVTLRDVNLFSTGLYGCEASAEESFHTQIVRKYMTVIGEFNL